MAPVLPYLPRPAPDRVPCDECGRMAASWRPGDVLVVKSWHNHGWHTTILTLHQLAAERGYRLVPVERDGV